MKKVIMSLLIPVVLAGAVLAEAPKAAAPAVAPAAAVALAPKAKTVKMAHHRKHAAKAVVAPKKAQ